MNPGVYRNQTQAIEEIKRMQRIRITTKAEAVAFLRALAPLHEQVAGVLQRTSIAEQHAMNRAKIAEQKEQEKPIAPAEQPAPRLIDETPKTLVPEDLSTDEGYTDKEVEEKVAKLKEATKRKTQKEIYLEEKAAKEAAKEALKNESSSKEKGN